MTSSSCNASDATPLSYRDAGVDIDAGDRLVENIKPLAKRTLRPEVLTGIGGFGALFEISKKYRNPVLVSGTDGVGTKLKLAFELDQHDTIGIDLVAMSVNDILVQGAEPLFFLDYFACGQLNVATATKVIGGIAKGCELAGCALIGGETAEMPGMYGKGDYDLAGFSVGAAERGTLLPKTEDMQPGDVIVGIASSGPHSNGYSLVRKIVERSGLAWDAPAPFASGKSLAEALLTPTRIYAKALKPIFEAKLAKGAAHITGGGLLENVPRVLPESTVAELEKAAWPRPKLFDWMQAEGNVAENEMHRVFNCGIGLVIVVAAADADAAMAELKAQGEAVYRIGKIRARSGDEAQTLVV